MSDLAGAVLELEPPDRPGVLRQFAEAGIDDPLVALASAIVRSASASRMYGAPLVVDHGPPQRLIFVGPIGAEARLLLEHLEAYIRVMGPHLALLTWHDVEASVCRLACRVRARFGAEDLETMVIHGAPRGGLILATLLAYELDVPQERLMAAGDHIHDGRQPVLLVDDAVYSGRRLARLLPSYRGSEVVVATVAASATLPAALAAATGVLDVLIDRQLPDLTDDALGEHREMWRSRWHDHHPDEPGYLDQLLPPVIFPWREPDSEFYNRLSGAVEDQWRLGPPDHCAAARRLPAQVPFIPRTQLPGAGRLANHVLACPLDDRLVLLDLHDRTSVRLRGSASELLLEWLSGRPSDALDRPRAAALQPVLRALLQRGWLQADTSIG